MGHQKFCYALDPSRSHAMGCMGFAADGEVNLVAQEAVEPLGQQLIA